MVHSYDVKMSANRFMVSFIHSALCTIGQRALERTVWKWRTALLQTLCMPIAHNHLLSFEWWLRRGARVDWISQAASQRYKFRSLTHKNTSTTQHGYIDKKLFDRFDLHSIVDTIACKWNETGDRQMLRRHCPRCYGRHTSEHRPIRRTMILRHRCAYHECVR